MTIDLNNTYTIVDYEDKCFRVLALIIKASRRNTFINIGVGMNNSIYFFSHNYYRWFPNIPLGLNEHASYYKKMGNVIFCILDSSSILRNFDNLFNSIILRYILTYGIPEDYGKSFSINDSITISVIEYPMPLVKIEVEDKYGKVHEVYGSMLINGGDSRLIKDVLNCFKG